MPFVRELPETADLATVQDALREAALYGYEVQRRIRQTGTPSEQDRADSRSAIDFIHTFDAIAQALERADAPAQRTGPGAAMAILTNPDQRSFGEMVVGHDRYARRAATQRVDFGATHVELELGGSIFASNSSDWRSMTEAQVRTLVDSGTTDGTSGDAGFFRPVGQPIAPLPRRQRVFIRDVIAVQGTGLSSVPYIREWDPTAYELLASAVQEAGTKPEVALAFEQDDAPIRKIAAWIPATTEVLDDAPTLRGYIDTRLAYMLALREERDILNGDGSSGRIKGILQYTTANGQTNGPLQTASGSDVPVAIATAIGLVENVEGDADGIAMNPTKYWGAMATRNANQFDGQTYGGGSPFDVPSGTIWGLPVVRTRSLAATKAVVGSWRLGATLFDRMRTTIRVGNQHSTYFVENKVAILAEERCGLAVHRPDFFVDVTLS